jgi:predicted PurR-regulated permease PerM
MWALGLDSPVLWGAAAFLLNFAPLLGPICCAVLLALAGLLTLDPLWRGLLPVAAYLVVHITEGQVVTPMLVARRFELSPVLVVISVVFWFWMWGVAGAIIAVPMLAILKIICDRVPPWKPIGHLLGA